MKLAFVLSGLWTICVSSRCYLLLLSLWMSGMHCTLILCFSCKLRKRCSILFIICLVVPSGRTFSYELASNSNLNAMLNSNDTSEYLKISTNGLEVCLQYSYLYLECRRSPFVCISSCYYSLSMAEYI